MLVFLSSLILLSCWIYSWALLSPNYKQLMKISICAQWIHCKKGCIYLYITRVKLGEGDGTRLQSSCLENPMDGGAWWAAVHGVAKSRTQLSDFTFTHWRRKWQPTPVFLPGESQRQWAPVYGVAQSWTRLKQLSSSSSRITIKELSYGQLRCPNCIQCFIVTPRYACWW